MIRQVISEETSKIMCEMLRSVVETGTAKNASVAGYAIGGKTGTSEKIDVLDANGKPTLDKIVSFVGVAPMEDPQYIVLVALDTPSRETGIYISGGVMAAPTVGAVLGDILPYLGVEKQFSESDVQSMTVVMPELTGMTVKEAKKVLAGLHLTMQWQGDGETITGQIPMPGQTLPGGSQVMVYLGEMPQQRQVSVPDFSGMTRQQAAEAAGALGLYILVRGNMQITHTVTVMTQNIATGTMVPVGETIELTFTDTAPGD